MINGIFLLFVVIFYRNKRLLVVKNHYLWVFLSVCFLFAQYARDACAARVAVGGQAVEVAVCAGEGGAQVLPVGEVEGFVRRMFPSIADGDVGAFGDEVGEVGGVGEYAFAGGHSRRRGARR